MSFYRETSIAAVRKPHRCAGCSKRMTIGAPALYLACFSPGGDHPFFGHYHLDCRAAEVVLNDLHDVRPGDDWIALNELEQDDHEWLRAEYPAVAERLFGVAVAA